MISSMLQSWSSIVCLVLVHCLTLAQAKLSAERIHSCDVTKYPDVVYNKNIIGKDIGSSQQYDIAECVKKCKQKTRCKAISITNVAKRPSMCLLHSASFVDGSDTPTYTDHRGSIHALVHCERRTPAIMSKLSIKFGHVKQPLQYTNSAGCGQQADKHRPMMGMQRIIGGKAAMAHSWPWLMQLRVDNGDGGFSSCGANLIDVKEGAGKSDILITAAHCVSENIMGDAAPPVIDAYRITAVAGQHNADMFEPRKETVKVFSVTLHDDFRVFPGVRLKHDIALVKLERPLLFNDIIRPICLPSHAEEPPVGKYCVTAGWGRYDSYSLAAAPVLQEVIAPVHHQSVCKFSWKDSFNEEQMLCAGSFLGDSGTCSGDSGGMLACREQGKDTWTLYGLPSVTVAGVCVMAGHPPLFTRVSSYVDAIISTGRQLTSVV